MNTKLPSKSMKSRHHHFKKIGLYWSPFGRWAAIWEVEREVLLSHVQSDSVVSNQVLCRHMRTIFTMAARNRSSAWFAAKCQQLRPQSHIPPPHQCWCSHGMWRWGLHKWVQVSKKKSFPYHCLSHGATYGSPRIYTTLFGGICPERENGQGHYGEDRIQLVPLLPHLPSSHPVLPPTCPGSFPFVLLPLFPCQQPNLPPTYQLWGLQAGAAMQRALLALVAAQLHAIWHHRWS